MATITYIVKVASGKFTIDDAVAPKLTFRDGDTYVFDQADNSNSGHILQFSATANNSGSSEYTTGVTKTGTPGSAGAKTTIVTSGSTTDTLYYYSSGGGDHGSEFSNSGFKTSSNFNFLKPIIGGPNTAEKWGSMVNHAIDQIDQNISSQDLDGATDSGTVAVDLDTQSLTVAGSNGIATSGSGQTITISGEALAYQGEPHIIPGVLYPAVAGKLLDGSTSHSGNYGTAQADGYSYYYTDIKGSKPIKDPRIGGHFGSQRHKFKSLQLLEQETATHGDEVYSIDGREWARFVRVDFSNPPTLNDDGGAYFQMQSSSSKTAILEVTGYFNELNIIGWTYGTGAGGNVDSSNPMNYHLNGGSDLGNISFKQTFSGADPKGSRYVDAGSVINVESLNATLGINTIKFVVPVSKYASVYGIELIAQDKFTDATCDYNNDPTITHDANTRIVAGLTVTGTGIPANATVASVTSSTEFELSAATTGGAVTNGTLTFGTNNIQIPSQNVVSYGKKFTVSGNPHYDPFNGFTNDTTLFSSVVDTATSLGLGTATTWGAPWDKGSNDHIRPFNGGRVVKWVDSSGTIKTSVTMMPANAQNIGTTASNEITTASATNSHTINFSDDAVENSLSEVAKTFHFREFGNGAANEGSSTSGTKQDASMYSAVDAIAYVMDDGLTSLSGDINVHNSGYGISVDATSKYFYITFIGTGISWKTGGAANNPNAIWAQNLPYGTHILKFITDGSNVWDGNVYLDGIDIKNDFASGSDREIYKWSALDDITFYQPKKPPIPEDAVVLADYMLMADHVPFSTAGREYMSKGVRFVNASRDIFYDEDSDVSFVHSIDVTESIGGLRVEASGQFSSGSMQAKLPYFGTKAVLRGRDPANRSGVISEYINSTSLGTRTNVGGNVTGGGAYHANSPTLGVNGIKVLSDQSAGHTNFHFIGFEIANPIHTSSHYQTFETPFLHELVGGDRNMEQTNLVVTPDGKTWDEVTRDTSYIGSICVTAGTDTGSTSGSTFQIFDEWRGVAGAGGAYKPFMNKDFAISYDRIVCLVDGWYEIHSQTLRRATVVHCHIKINGVTIQYAHGGSSDHDTPSNTVKVFLKRGDYIQNQGAWYISLDYCIFQISRL